MTTTTIDLDTELSAVNAILGSIGQSPISGLDFANPEISFIYNLLKESSQDIQNEGWTFNIEYHIKETVGADNKIIIESDVIRIDNEDAWDRTRDFVRRKDADGIWKLYDRVDHTFEFPDDDYFYVNKVRLLLFEDIPSVFQRYIIYKASGRAAVQLVSNQQLQGMLATYEAQARAACMEYECNQGDHNYMGWPDESAYQSYKPYVSLRR
ncbi:MAG: hypothetical protein CL508_06620 [Actinobacteria bacterium]|mgnify:FL=1|nr:hypothetical protein [Actinomycetota bacterium]